MVDIAPVAEPVFERVQLDETSWVDICRGWLVMGGRCQADWQHSAR